MKNIDQFRIHQVPAHPAECHICERRRTCYYVDHDFRGASVCIDCTGFVIIAETILRDSGLEIPAKTYLGPMPDDPHASIP